MATASNYIPGMCNINPKEIAQRRMIGNIGLISTIILTALLVGFSVDALFRVIVFIPTFLAATGYLQARNKFCVGYAGAKQHHADDGAVVTISDEAALAADKKRARTINLQALMIAIFTTVIVVMIPPIS